METRQQRILIVDDDLSTAQCLKLGLETRGGYEVQAESSGLRGLAAARVFRPDLFLLDICMPDMTGDRLAEAFRGDPQFKYTPIIFMTSLVAPSEEPPDGLKSAGFLFLSKPVTVPKVIGCIEAYLGPAPTRVGAAPPVPTTAD